MKKIIYLLIVILLFSCSNQNDSLIKIINNKDNYFSYTLHEKNKPLFKTDTISTIYNIHLQKNKNDSLYGFDFKIERMDNYIFNINNTTYYFDHKKKSLHTSNKFKSSINKLLLPNNKLILEDLYDTLNVQIIKNKNEYILKKRYDDTKEFNNIYSTYSISKETNQYSKITKNINFQFTNQFNEYYFDNFKYNIKTNLKKEVSDLKNEYFFTKNNKSSEKKSIIKFKNFKGEIIGNNKIISISDYKNKIIILDYWYMACYPSIKTIPYLNSLHKKYNKGDVIILGVNFIDNKPKKFEKLVKFKEFNKIQYPILITDENPFNVKEHPTIIVINKKQQIISTLVGYDKNKEAKLDSIIENEIKKTATNNGYE
jgi:hypothetical protein